MSMTTVHRSSIASSCTSAASGRVRRGRPVVRDVTAHGKRGLQALQELEADREEEQVLVGVFTETLSELLHAVGDSFCTPTF